MKKTIKSITSLILLAVVTITLIACSTRGDQLIVWTFTDELEGMINDYYIPNNPGVDIKVEKYPLSSLTTRLTNSLRTGTNLPDLVALEAANVLQFVGSGYLLPLNDIAESSEADNMYQYTKDIVTTENGDIVGLAWQATPGAFFYRSDIAKEVLDVDTPEEMQPLVETWEKFIETAGLLEQEDVKMISSLAEPMNVFLSQRNQGWIRYENGQSILNIDEALTSGEYNPFRVLRDLESEPKYVNGTTERSSAWYADMSGNSVFGYFLSSWGLHHELKANSRNATTGVDTAGNWAVVRGPGAFYNGGTWLSVIKGSRYEQQAKDIVKYFTTDEAFLLDWATASGDFMNNKVVMNEIKDDFQEAFLGNQNHFELLYDVAEEIDGSLITQYDAAFDGIYKDHVIRYALGQITTIENAVAQFKSYIDQRYQDVIVE